MAEFDASKPSIARIYDYVLGGRDNFASDRALADQIMGLAPTIPLIVRENKAFLQRAVAWAAQQGIGQFIDLGCGMPTPPSTYETARAERPDARVACIDIDPVVINHLIATQGKNPAITIVDADLQDADTLLRAIGDGIDLTRSAALMLGMILHFIELEAGIALVRRYVDALAPGSCVIASVGILDDTPEADKFAELYGSGPALLYRHKLADVRTFFGDLDMVPPGIADTRSWRAGWDTVPEAPPRVVAVYGGVGRL